MTFNNTTAVKKIVDLKKRIKIIQGGTSAGKTIAILLILIDIAQTHNNLLISVVSESMPHLKRGAIRDFLNIMEGHKYFDDKKWNKTDYTYNFETGTKIEFFSADIPGKVRGPRRDILFINECNNVNYETYTQLEIRTKDTIYLDYNPVAEFWALTEVKLKDNADFLTITYKDNESLDKNIVESIEARKGNKQWWLVYGLGQLGEVEGKIYNDWAIVDEIPHEARLSRRGLDFGYSIDPSVMIDIYEYNGGFILDETIYQKGLSNKAIADTIHNLPEPHTMVIADSAEPKSIDEIHDYGINILPALKGPGSVNKGIQMVQSLRISLTKRSTKTIKAYRNFLWATNKDGDIMNIPDDSIHEWSNPMDAIRYGLGDYKKKSQGSIWIPNNTL